MRSALYYPHTTVRSESLIKTSLLLWDQLEFLAPRETFRPQYENREHARAMELFGYAHAPTAAEKQQTHERIEDIIERGVPEAFKYRAERPSGRQDYEIYPQKFLDKTWRMLQRSNLAGAILDNSDYPLEEGAGLAVMAVLADCCAGETRARVTDRGAAYASITNVLAEPSSVVDTNSDLYDQVIPITVNLINVDEVSLADLIAFREREQRERDGHHYRALRHSYLDKVEAHIERLRNAPATDQRELNRIFEQQMADDMSTLREELGASTRETLRSNEVIVTALSAISAISALPIMPAVTLGGAAVMLGGLWRAQDKYVASRRSIMQKHPMAYMYALQNNPA